MKVYVAGPMTGYPELNYPAFALASDRLRQRGFDVVSPAELNVITEDYRVAMRKNISALVDSRPIYGKRNDFSKRKTPGASSNRDRIRRAAM